MLLTMLMTGLFLGAADSWHANPVFAENADEIEIRADYMKFNLDTGDSIYQGNVSIVQGGIRLTGDRVIIHRDPGNTSEISNIEVSGNPASYQQDENTDKRVYAVSQHMKYSTTESRLVMTNNARLEQSDQTVESQRIVYDTENKVIIAGKEDADRKEGERVNITLTPKKNDTKENQ